MDNKIHTSFEKKLDLNKVLSFIYFSVIMYISIYFITEGKINITEIIAIVIIGSFFYEFLKNINTKEQMYNFKINKNYPEILKNTTFTNNGKIIIY